MNKKLLTMVTTGAIAISNMNFAFAEGFMATPDDSEFPMFVDGGIIPECSIPEGEEPIFEKIPNAHIPELEMLMEEIDDEAVEPGDDIMDDVISGEEYEEEETEDVIDEDEPIDEEIIDEAEMERLEREEHEKELAEKEQAEKEQAKHEDEVIGGIDDDYYDVGEEEEVKDEDPAENIDDTEEEEVKESTNKEVTHKATTKDTNINNDTARAIGKSTPSKLKEYQRELEKPLNLSKDNSGNPKTGDMGIIGSIVGMVTAVGGIILRKKL